MKSLLKNPILIFFTAWAVASVAVVAAGLMKGA